MAPAAYQPFFVASMGTAAALLGLLFVAVSVAPERTVGPSAPVERHTVAESVFTALIDAFFVSMAGTIPNFNLGDVALALSAFALLQTLYAAWRLWPRPFAVRSLIQRLALVVVALVIYSLQFNDASQLVRAPSPVTSVGSEISLLFALYAFALGRSWDLLGARRGILSRGANSTFETDGQPAVVVPTATQPAIPTEAADVAQRRHDEPSNGPTRGKRRSRPPSPRRAGP